MAVEHGEVTMPAEVWCEQNMRSGMNRMMGCVPRVVYPCKCGSKAPHRRGGPRAAKHHKELALRETLPLTLHSVRAEQHMHEGTAMFFPL